MFTNRVNPFAHTSRVGCYGHELLGRAFYLGASEGPCVSEDWHGNTATGTLRLSAINAWSRTPVQDQIDDLLDDLRP